MTRTGGITVLKRRLSVILLLTFIVGEIYVHFQPTGHEASVPPARPSWHQLAWGAYQVLTSGKNGLLLAANAGGSPFAELVPSQDGYRLVTLAYRLWRPARAPVSLELARTVFEGRTYWRPLGEGWNLVALSPSGRVAGLVGREAYLATGRGWASWSGVDDLLWSPNGKLLLERDGRLWRVASDGQLQPLMRLRGLAPNDGRAGRLPQGPESISVAPAVAVGLSQTKGGLRPNWPLPPGWQSAGYPVSELSSGNFLMALVRRGRLATFLVRPGFLPTQDVG